MFSESNKIFYTMLGGKEDATSLGRMRAEQNHWVLQFADFKRLWISFKGVNSGKSPWLLVVSYSVVSDSLRPQTVACKAPLSMGLSRQEYWSGFPTSFFNMIDQLYINLKNLSGIVSVTKGSTQFGLEDHLCQSNHFIVCIMLKSYEHFWWIKTNGISGRMLPPIHLVVSCGVLVFALNFIRICDIHLCKQRGMFCQ